MTAPTWEFTGHEFDAIWEAVDEGTMPAPFVYRCPPRTFEEGEYQRKQLWAELRQRWGRDLDDMIEVLVRPDIRVVVRGYGGGDTDTDPALAVRLLAVRRGDTGYVVRQTPGETIYDATGFTVAQHDALSLGEVLADLMPTVGGGREREIELAEPSAAEFDYGYGRSLVQHYDDEVSDKATAFREAPDRRSGTVVIEQGWSRFGPRGVVRMSMGWRDLVDDGRYFIVPGAPTVAVGADKRRVVGLINAQIAEVVRAIRDDRS
ncbi:ESX secretion-associated protein EspG [Nocardia sp. NPDC058519]|uniref:ESX secretion-associated protein EspG n=1 Tax=unclassified Nocardia TaxID=2637762 RepID=UPI0036579C24